DRDAGGRPGPLGRHRRFIVRTRARRGAPVVSAGDPAGTRRRLVAAGPTLRAGAELTMWSEEDSATYRALAPVAVPRRDEMIAALIAAAPFGVDDAIKI